MRKIAILATLVASIMSGCAVNEVNTLTQTESLPNLSAGFAESATKTYVENNKYLRWHEDDRLTAFYGNALNRQYKFNGSTGANSGTFSLVPNGELGTGNTLNAIYAVYPYDETATITDEGVISLTLPATQLYAENSFGKNANTMIAVTENLEDTFLAFKNACGYLKLKLYNADGVRINSIEVKGNNGEKIAGKATATMEFGGEPSLVMADDTTESITLDCGDGVLLGTTAETATEFWFVVPETTFEGGVTISVKDELGGKFEKSTTNKVIISRNEIQPMVALNADAFVSAIPNNEIWYTSTDGNIVTPYAGAKFGANIISNTYENGKGVIKFDGNVTKIGYDAFEQCSSLTSVTIPDSVTSIGYYAFYDCTSLKRVDICDLSAWCKISFGDSLANPLYYGAKLYLNGSELTDITIPSDITEIKDYTFYKYTSLTSVTIPDSVTSIGNYAFYYCSSLISITIGNGVTEIEGYAFENCTSLTSITIGNGVTSIGDDAFYYCSSLTRVDITDLSAWCKISFGDISTNPLNYGAKLYLNGSELTDITIPSDITEIKDYTFCKCTSLTSITIPDSVTEIGFRTFYKCTSLTSVTIGNGVTSIGDDAFENCTSLTSVTIPDSVTSIGSSAFYGCTSLKEVYCKPTTPPTGGHDMFSYYNSGYKPIGCKIYVPIGSGEAYKAKQYWSNYASYIEEKEF